MNNSDISTTKPANIWYEIPPSKPITLSRLDIWKDATNSRENKWDRRFLDLATFISTWSLDPSTKVGAVITEGTRTVSLGYNGLPMGVADTIERLTDRELKYKMVVHAERNAIIFAQRSLICCTIYTYPFMPCAACAGMVIQAGISRVVSFDSNNPRWQADFDLSKQMFKEAGVELTLLTA